MCIAYIYNAFKKLLKVRKTDERVSPESKVLDKCQILVSNRLQIICEHTDEYNSQISDKHCVCKLTSRIYKEEYKEV